MKKKNKKLKCYYAHTMLSYNSTIEKEDITMLKLLGFKVFNPNQGWVQNECDEHIKEHGKDKTMEYFEHLIDDCDILAFRGNPDGSILSGISHEVQYAMGTYKPIIEIPCSLTKRMMDYPETKKYLIEIGHYKI